VRQCRAMASQRKPVIVRKFSREWFAGYAEAALAGRCRVGDSRPDRQGARIGWDQVKVVCYVRDFPAQSADSLIRAAPSQAVLPSGRGLPLVAALTLTDDEELEGLRRMTALWWKAPAAAHPQTPVRIRRDLCAAPAIQTLEV